MMVDDRSGQFKDAKAGKEICPAMPAWKRLVDLACCLAFMPFLMAGALVMTVVTKLVSPGPVFYRQVRIGYMGRPFKIYKFRTMTVGADTGVHQSYCKQLIGTNAPMTKLDAKGDARLIPGGWILRASGLDELPQILNVLRGEMSLVGPRPCLPAEFEEYQPWQRARCRAVPGLTGLWQVSGKNRTTFEEMIHLDVKYAETIGFWQDMRIIVLTPVSLLRQILDTVAGRKASAIPKRPATALPALRTTPASRSRTPFRI